jgi:hypothetical protein
MIIPSSYSILFQILQVERWLARFTEMAECQKLPERLDFAISNLQFIFTWKVHGR